MLYHMSYNSVAVERWLPRTWSFTSKKFFKTEASVIALVIRVELVILTTIVYEPRFSFAKVVPNSTNRLKLNIFCKTSNSNPWKRHTTDKPKIATLFKQKINKQVINWSFLRLTKQQGNFQFVNQQETHTGDLLIAIKLNRDTQGEKLSKCSTRTASGQSQSTWRCLIEPKINLIFGPQKSQSVSIYNSILELSPTLWLLLSSILKCLQKSKPGVAKRRFEESFSISTLSVYIETSWNHIKAEKNVPEN